MSLITPSNLSPSGNGDQSKEHSSIKVNNNNTGDIILTGGNTGEQKLTEND